MYADDVSTRTMKRKTLLLALFIVGGLLLALGVAFAVAVANRPGVSADGAVRGVHAGEPQTEEEKAVAAWILADNSAPNNKYSQAGKIEWVEWGPNRIGEPSARAKRPVVVRVRYTSTRPGMVKRTDDELYAYDSGNPSATIEHVDNPDGAKWIDVAKARWDAIQAESMKGPHR